MITYRYARGDSGRLCDITDLSEQTRRADAPYRCIGCGGELIVNLPRSKSKHFSHKSSHHCALETYLHSLAKHCFAQTYREALSSGAPFILEVTRPAECNRHEQDLGQICKITIADPFDLTRVYQQVDLEVDTHGLRPDILLTSRTAPPLFVEIAVTHRCSADKIASGHRILELQISSENDLSAVRDRCIRDSAPNVKTYNFQRKLRTGHVCQDKCRKQATFFVTYRSGKGRLLEGSLDEIAEQAKRAVICEPAIEPSGSDKSSTATFLTNVRHHYFRGVSLRNCVLCRHHRIPDEGPLWCSNKRVQVRTNDAADCAAFAPLASEEECLEAERRNLQQVRERGEALARRMMGRY